MMKGTDRQTDRQTERQKQVTGNRERERDRQTLTSTTLQGQVDKTDVALKSAFGSRF